MVVVVPRINLPVITHDGVLLVALLHVSETANWRACVVPYFTIMWVAQKVMLLFSFFLSLCSPFPYTFLPSPPTLPPSNKASNMTFWVMCIFEVPVICV